jgi:hypothetical protein
LGWFRLKERRSVPTGQEAQPAQPAQPAQLAQLAQLARQGETRPVVNPPLRIRRYGLCVLGTRNGEWRMANGAGERGKENGERIQILTKD